MLSLRRSSLPCACSRVALPFRHVLAPVRRQSITSPGGLAREFEELERLRTALSRSQAEVTQLRTNLRSQEIQNERNSEELRTYREALSKVFLRPVCMSLCSLTMVNVILMHFTYFRGKKRTHHRVRLRIVTAK